MGRRREGTKGRGDAPAQWGHGTGCCRQRRHRRAEGCTSAVPCPELAAFSDLPRAAPASPSLLNHRCFRRGSSGSQRGVVNRRGARQESAPAADPSGNGEGAAPAPARAQPGQRQPRAPMELGWETTAKDGAGRASAPARPASSPSCMRNWERKLESRLAPCRRMGQAVCDANQGFESARHAALGSSPFTLLGIATALVNSPSHAALGATHGTCSHLARDHSGG